VVLLSVIKGRYTARTDEPFVVFFIGMWLPLHKNPEAVERGVLPARPTENYHNVPAV
jgi:hypothetical protein